MLAPYTRPHTYGPHHTPTHLHWLPPPIHALHTTYMAKYRAPATRTTHTHVAHTLLPATRTHGLYLHTGRTHHLAAAALYHTTLTAMDRAPRLDGARLIPRLYASTRWAVFAVCAAPLRILLLPYMPAFIWILHRRRLPAATRFRVLAINAPRTRHRAITTCDA